MRNGLIIIFLWRGVIWIFPPGGAFHGFPAEIIFCNILANLFERLHGTKRYVYTFGKLVQHLSMFLRGGLWLGSMGLKKRDDNIVQGEGCVIAWILSVKLAYKWEFSLMSPIQQVVDIKSLKSLNNQRVMSSLM